MKNIISTIIVALLLFSTHSSAIGNPSNIDEQNSQTLSFVTIENTHNKPDPTTGYGSVSESFDMGIGLVTTTQYCEFLNAVATTGDPNNLYDFRMAENEIIQNKSSNTNAANLYSYNVVPGSENQPITYVNWFSAARFCNWIGNNSKAGPQTLLTTEGGTYSLYLLTPGAENNTIVPKNSDALISLPSMDQWYKAGFYHPHLTDTHGHYYPLSSANEATFSGYYGITSTIAQNQWLDGYDNSGNLYAGIENGALLPNSPETSSPYTASATLGFRIVQSIPAPAAPATSTTPASDFSTPSNGNDQQLAMAHPGSTSDSSFVSDHPYLTAFGGLAFALMGGYYFRGWMPCASENIDEHIEYLNSSDQHQTYTEPTRTFGGQLMSYNNETQKTCFYDGFNTRTVDGNQQGTWKSFLLPPQYPWNGDTSEGCYVPFRKLLHQQLGFRAYESIPPSSN